MKERHIFLIIAVMKLGCIMAIIWMQLQWRKDFHRECNYIRALGDFNKAFDANDSNGMAYWQTKMKDNQAQ